MHGRISGTPARLSAYGVREADGGLEAFVEGMVTQVAVFGEHLTLTRRIRIAYGSAVIHVDDQVENRGYATSPLAVMYHVNIGWPVVAPGARVKTPSRRLQRRGRQFDGWRAGARRLGAGFGFRRGFGRKRTRRRRDRQRASRRRAGGGREAHLGCGGAADAGAMGAGECRGPLCHRA